MSGPPVRILRQKRQDEGIDIAADRAARATSAWRLRRLCQVRKGNVCGSLELKDGHAREQLVHQGAERVDVRCRVGTMATNLLGRYRLGRAEHGHEPAVAVRQRGTLA